MSAPAWRCERCGARCVNIPRYDDTHCEWCARELGVFYGPAALPPPCEKPERIRPEPAGYHIERRIERFNDRVAWIRPKR